MADITRTDRPAEAPRRKARRVREPVATSSGAGVQPGRRFAERCRPERRDGPANAARFGPTAITRSASGVPRKQFPLIGQPALMDEICPIKSVPLHLIIP